MYQKKKMTEANTMAPLDEFKKLSINSVDQLKIGMVLYTKYPKKIIIRDLVIDAKNNDCDGWIVFNRLDDRIDLGLESISVADSNICNGGYNPWLVFDNEETCAEYIEWTNLPKGKGALLRMENNPNYSGGWDSKYRPVWDKPTIPCERKSRGELLIAGFKLVNFTKNGFDLKYEQVEGF